MKKYEYKCEQFNPNGGFKGFNHKKLEDFLKDYGEEGWELIEVTISHQINYYIYYFKREIL